MPDSWSPTPAWPQGPWRCSSSRWRGSARACAIPRLPPAAPGLALTLNPWASTRANLEAARASRAVFLSLLGLSWFWFYGALLLAQLPGLAGGGGADVVTLMLVVLAVAVGSGALLCERLSGHKVEIGLVPFGSIGLTLFALDLGVAAPQPAATAPGVGAFLAQPHALRLLIDLAGLGLFGGLYACRCTQWCRNAPRRTRWRASSAPTAC